MKSILLKDMTVVADDNFFPVAVVLACVLWLIAIIWYVRVNALNRKSRIRIDDLAQNSERPFFYDEFQNLS